MSYQGHQYHNIIIKGMPVLEQLLEMYSQKQLFFWMTYTQSMGTIWSNILLVKLTLNIYKLFAYPSEYLWQEFKAIRVFLVAKVKDQKVMNAVEYEQDVLLGNFQESYKHLSFKHILGLSWATSR